ncbi:MAG: Ku protein [Acidimicrobiia bacterium]|nr:Ku protein [Acidimicrobiia bacterium]
MARAVWSGSISFGLVNVPVKAFTAVRGHEVHFHQLEKKTGARINNKRVSEKSGREVDGDDIEMGYEISKGRYVTFEKGEIDELKPDSTRTIDVSDFVALADIDPIYYERTYWLAPDGDAGVKAYQLLLAAMEDRQRVGIGEVVMRNKQYLAALRPLDGVLAMSTMRFADEIVPQSDIDQLPSRRAKADPKEVKLATQIIDSLEAEWDPKRYHDTYTEELRSLIERKGKGEDVVVHEEEQEDEGAKVLDLMAALEASVAAAKEKRTGSKRSSAATKSTGTKARSTRKAAPAEKAAAKKKAAARPARKSA